MSEKTDAGGIPNLTAALAGEPLPKDTGLPKGALLRSPSLIIAGVDRGKPDAFAILVDKLITEYAPVLPRKLQTRDVLDRLREEALQALRTDPKLMRASMQSPASLAEALISSLRFGLSVDPQRGHVHMATRGGEVSRVVFMIGYLGMVDLLRRGGALEVYAEVVHVNDEFSVSRGTNPHINHVPDYFCSKAGGDESERGRRLGAYAVAKLPNGGCEFEVMSAEDIGQIRDMSSKPEAWRLWPDAMWQKTVLRRLAKRLPWGSDLAMSEALSDAPAFETSESGEVSS